jgi:CDP-glycerol glycerophosphotransferase (TagB/SpsB family)
MKIFYFANQLYQYSYTLPIYRALGGTFIVKSIKRYFQFKKHLAAANISPEVKTFRNTPRIKMTTMSGVSELDGIVISASNAPIHSDKKKCITIFVGHGTGDKKYGPNVQYLEKYDYHFISGPKHLEKLLDVGLKIPEERLIKIGNPRFDDYINNRINRSTEFDRLGIKDRERKNVLYAPTWKWGNGTLHQYVYQFAREISQKYNLIIRPHHHDRKSIPKIKRWVKSQRIQHVYFSNPISLVTCDTMNDFMVSDILISDTSSILYEFLITHKPIIVIKNQFDDLHHMPNEMDIMKYVATFDDTRDITKLIDQNLAEQKYKAVFNRLLHNCFYFNDGKSVQRIATFLQSIA